MKRAIGAIGVDDKKKAEFQKNAKAFASKIFADMKTNPGVYDFVSRKTP